MFLKMFVRGGGKVWFVRSLIIDTQQEGVVYRWYFNLDSEDWILLVQFFWLVIEMVSIDT